MGLGKTKVFLLGLFLLICDEEIFLGQHSIQNLNDVDKHGVIKKSRFFKYYETKKRDILTNHKNWESLNKHYCKYFSKNRY